MNRKIKIINTYRKTKRQQVFDILDRQGIITDRQARQIGIKTYNIYDYTMMWKRLRYDEEFFKDKKIVEKKHTHRNFLVRTKGQEHYFKVGSLFYNSIKEL